MIYARHIDNDRLEQLLSDEYDANDDYDFTVADAVDPW